MTGIRRATLDDKQFIIDLYNTGAMMKYLTDDNSLSIIDFGIENIINVSSIYPLISEMDDIKSGLFLFFPWNYTTYELHVAILPKYRGQHSIEAGTMAGMWMFNNTVCRKIVTMIPKQNYKAKALAIAVGMQQEGINRQSYMKDGVLYDQYLFGICKGDVQ
jgi:RimJ/RimL family protein N-acetyltransferase